MIPPHSNINLFPLNFNKLTFQRNVRLSSPAVTACKISNLSSLEKNTALLCCHFILKFLFEPHANGHSVILTDIDRQRDKMDLLHPTL